MAILLTKQELQDHLMNFRETLSNFDYSPIQNIRFLNLESLYFYMENIKDNPFQKQYQELQKHLDFLQPYLPFVSSERASEFLTSMSKATDDDELTAIKKDYTQKLRMDFINFARTHTSDHQWGTIFDTCEEIRLQKEESALALY
ncbi:MAG: hypothetical protein ACRCTE_01800 [Cellulosilyticaceae bacterium]